MSKNLQLLYGSGNKKRIVAIENVPNKDNIMEVFYRDSLSSGVTSEYKTFKPFIYLNENDSIFSKLFDDTEIKKLGGSLHYNRMVKDSDFGTIYWIRKEADDAYMPFKQSQWMLSTGQTQFKGMDFDDPLRLYCDIETLTKEGYDFSNSTREEDKICIISMWSNRGDAWVLVLNEDGKTQAGENIYRCKSEKILLEKWVRCIRNINPDIICGHHFFGYDLPYIEDRAQMFGVELKLGRGGQTPNSFDTTVKFAEKADEYTNYQIYGRHILDTYFMAKQFDIVARKLDNYGLKYCAEFLGGIGEDRTYVEGSDITWTWFNNRQKLIDYALDDVKETQLIDRNWGRNMFAQTQMIPLPMQDVFRYGTGNKIDVIFNRAYYNYNWSWPKPEPQRDFSGGYAGTGKYGVVNEPLVYLDVGSMYPTLSEILKIQPKSDELKLYPQIIKLLKEQRYKYKNLMLKEQEMGNDVLADRYDATQSGLKILLNTASFGYLGSTWGAFNDYDEAERITKNGRDITKQILKECQSLGGQPIKFDTDGAIVTVPDKYRDNKESELRFIKQVEKNVNVWIKKQL